MFHCLRVRKGSLLPLVGCHSIQSGSKLGFLAMKLPTEIFNHFDVGIWILEAQTVSLLLARTFRHHNSEVFTQRNYVLVFSSQVFLRTFTRVQRSY